MSLRWPNLRRIDDPPPWLDRRHHARVLRACREVKARTGVDAFIDLFRRDISFGYECGGDVRLFDINCPLYRGAGVEAGFDPVFDKKSVDDVVYLVQLARVGESRKARWRANREAEGKKDDAEVVGRTIEEGSREVEEVFNRQHERRGLSRHFQKSHLVTGLKE